MVLIYRQDTAYLLLLYIVPKLRTHLHVVIYSTCIYTQHNQLLHALMFAFNIARDVLACENVGNVYTRECQRDERTVCDVCYR